METLHSIYAKKDRNGPPSTNQIISTAKPRCGYAVCTFRYTHPPPPSLSFLLKQNLSPKDIVGSDIMKQKIL